MKKKVPLLGSVLLVLAGHGGMWGDNVFAQETPTAPLYLAQAESPGKSETFLNRLNPANWENPLSKNKKDKKASTQNSSQPTSGASGGGQNWTPVGTQLQEMPEDPFSPPTAESLTANDSAQQVVMKMIYAAGISPEAAGAPITPFELDERTFLLSYQNLMTPQNTSAAKEIRLYASRDRGKTWQLYQKAGTPQITQPETQTFTIKVANDGEYWFSFRMLDAREREHPSAAPVTQVVVKEVKKANTPGVTVPGGGSFAGNGSPAGGAAGASLTGHSVVRQPIQRPQWSPDSNSGPVLGGASGSGRTVGATAGESFRDSVPFSVAQMDAVYANSERMLPVYRIQRPEPIQREAAKPVTADGNALGSGAAESMKTTGAAGNVPGAGTLPESFALTDNTLDGMSAAGEMIDLSALPGVSDPESESLSAGRIPEMTPAKTPEKAPSGEDSPENSFAANIFASLEGPINSAKSHESHIQYTNNPRVEVEYDVSNVGSSGVGRVELWGTLDGGQSWNFLAEDKDRESPIPVDLKAEGDYGLQIVVLNGAGVGSDRPVAGSLPQMQVTFDRTPPQLVIQSVRLLADFGELEVRWDAADQNFGPQCVVLSWSESLDGKWRAITSQAVPNDGVHTWSIPENLPGKIFVRVDAVDLAGNATSLVTGPVITDLSRPTATILNAKPAK